MSAMALPAMSPVTLSAMSPVSPLAMAAVPVILVSTRHDVIRISGTAAEVLRSRW